MIDGLNIDGLLQNDDPRVVVIVLAMVPEMGLLESNHASSASSDRKPDEEEAGTNEGEDQSGIEPIEIVVRATCEALVVPAALRGAV